MKKHNFIILILITALYICVLGCAPSGDMPDYSRITNWAYLEIGDSAKTADVFFICPTVYMGEDGKYNMSFNDNEAKSDFIGAINMEKGIYDADARFFAPYYSQAALSVYEMPETEREKYLDAAYNDVETAFDFYYKNLNGGRPIILAGFSQGADMCLRLMKERFNNPAMADKLIACYAVGWSITQEELDKYPYLKFAQSKNDLGVIISFNSEAPQIESSLIVPENVKSLAINPLSWSTAENTADKSLNDGACFTDTEGGIVSEIDNFTGAYIDPKRGTLKVTDVKEEDYPPQLEIFEDGVYHVYDYQFFYRNLQGNVAERIRAFKDISEFPPDN